jgi:hypothetical protein
MAKRRGECHRYDEETGIWIRTWVGTRGDAKSSEILTAIEKSSEAKHFVYLENLKTYPISVSVLADVHQDDPKIRFEGGPSVSSCSWKATRNLVREPHLIDDAWVKRRRAGQEVIRVYLSRLRGGKSSNHSENDPPLEIPLTVK